MLTRKILATMIATLTASALADPVTTPAAVESAPVVDARAIPATPIPVVAPQPLICRSTLETGSLVKRHKQCLTKSQWRYVDDQHETAARRLVEESTGKPFCDTKC